MSAAPPNNGNLSRRAARLVCANKRLVHRSKFGAMGYPMRSTRESVSLSGVAARRTVSPGGKGTSERRAPERQAAWARVAEFCRRPPSPVLDAPLRLAAQQHHKFRSLAGFRAQRLVRDDQGRSRRNIADAIQCVLRNGDAVERGLCAVRVRRHWLNAAPSARARPVVWLNRGAGRTSAVQ